MSYESVINQIKNTPVRYLSEISHFIEFLNQKSLVESNDEKTPVQNFLELSWEDSRNADDILNEIETSRCNVGRFGVENAIFD